MPKNKKWGGKRKGAGRKPSKPSKPRKFKRLVSIKIANDETLLGMFNPPNRSAAVDFLVEWWAEQQKGKP